jgi:hypothetical protein
MRELFLLVVNRPKNPLIMRIEVVAGGRALPTGEHSVFEM